VKDLKILREASGLSQFSLANRVGVNRVRISLAENGHVKLNIEEQSAIRRVLMHAIQRRAHRLAGVIENTK
jgi:transcriptional regulator with XRE-family HTH domain